MLKWAGTQEHSINFHLRNNSAKLFEQLYRASFVILYNDQPMHKFNISHPDVFIYTYKVQRIIKKHKSFIT